MDPLTAFYSPGHSCTDCPLSSGPIHNPGLPTRLADLPASPDTRDAILFVGEAPGYHEDQSGKSWVGPSGRLLHAFIETAGLHHRAHIYLSNAARCFPASSGNPTVGQVNRCRAHLQADLNALAAHGYEHLTLVCCGRWATFSVAGLRSLSDAFSNQGRYLDSLGTKALVTPASASPIPVFFTYHPAILLPGRKPQLVNAVAAHFSLILRYLTEGRVALPSAFQTKALTHQPVPNSFDWVELPDSDPQVLDPRALYVSVDIETYGILRGYHQSAFHPVKSRVIDGIDYADQVVSLAFSLFDPEAPSGIRSYFYVLPRDRLLVRGWFQRLVSDQVVLIGQNLRFDLQYLAHYDSMIRRCLVDKALHNPRFRLDDSMILSFLLYDQRPERGLKELVTLFGLADYQPYRGNIGALPSRTDPALQHYNVLDSAVTLHLYHYLHQQIHKTYGPRTFKLSKACAEMRNAILWDVFVMENSGICLDLHRLHGLRDSLDAERQSLIDEASRVYGLLLSGSGSQKSLRDFFQSAVDMLNLHDDSRLKYTAKRHDLSIGIDNAKFLLGRIPDDTPGAMARIRQPLQLYIRYQALTKLLSSYVNVLCTDRRRGITIPSKGIAFPSWFPIPSKVSKSGSSPSSSATEGGTIQGRFSAKDPACQTFPPAVKKCLASRYRPNGILVEYDLSRIEVRIAALLSGDPRMIMEFEKGLDCHTETALLLFPDADPSDPSFNAPHGPRHLGKTLRFLMLYRGGASKFRETVLAQSGQLLDLDFCQRAIDLFNQRYFRFRQWQDELIREVQQTGYLELPTGWSRTFSKDPRSIASLINEIVNFPIQTLAAQLLQSAQHRIVQELHRRFPGRAAVVAQVHDSIHIDMESCLLEAVEAIVDRWLTNPPLLSDCLVPHLGRTIPIRYSRTLISSPSQ